ncbi:uncharacterized protein LOC131997160 [Stomoxys calcitrans]|uniref:uncharacterized protein LOC131997160 n=1 Tax=Stomoxys calcitrans TaxID=35570 RepID=UPI0027E226C0|nr:uncharacterized protein LOC131997160 [Stomoxys calcitrans]
MTAVSVPSSMSRRVSVLAAFCIVVILLLLVIVWVVRGSSCTALENCDQFKAICASSGTEHQFFYSHCDMVRDNCLTGKNWKRDHFSHCNVN